MPPSADILVVDADPSSRHTLSDMLENAGYRIRSTDDPKTGLDAALAEPPRLIVLSTRMPGMDGFELCRRLRADARTSAIPVIFTVDHHDHEDLGRCYAEGGTESICRPYLEAEVLGRIKIQLRIGGIAATEGMPRASEEHLRTLIDQTPLAIEVHSRDGKFLLSNPAYSRISGLHGAELQAVRESFDLRRDEQLLSLGFGPLLAKLYGGENVEFPIHEYNVSEGADDLGIEVANAGPYRLRTIGFPLKDRAGRTEAVVLMTEDLTGQAQATAKLENLQDFADHIFEDSPVSIQIHDLDGRLVRWNAAFAKLYALDDDGLTVLRERYDLRRDAQADALGLLPFVERVYQGQDVVFPPYEYSGADTLKTLDSANPVSRRCWVQTTGFPLRDGQGNVMRTVFMSEDINERMQAEENLAHQRAYTDHLIETANVMIVSLDSQGRVTNFNPAAETITGYTLAEVEGKGWFELLVPSERYPEVHTVFEHLAEGDFPQAFENPIVTKAGEERYVSWRNSKVTRDGALIGTTSFGIDITQRKEFEEALKDSEENFRQLMAQSPLSIQVLNTAGYIEHVNQAWMDLWGISEETLEALKASWCILEDEQVKEAGLMPLVERAFRGERVDLPDLEYDAESAFDAAGLPVGGAPKRWVRAYLYAVLNQNGEVVHVVDVEQDITEAKVAELKVRDYQDRLRALVFELTISEENERRRIAVELHDNAAQSLALARLRLAAAAKHINDERASRQLDDLSQLLRDSLQQIRALMMDLSSPALSELGLGAAIAEWLEIQLRTRHGLRISFDSTCDHLEIDEVVASLLFRNTRELLANVVKHAGAGSVAVRLACIGDDLQITVSDDGCGFSTAELALRPSVTGGFGLFSIQERMTDLGGGLDVETTPGSGCTAVLRIPQDRLTRKD